MALMAFTSRFSSCSMLLQRVAASRVAAPGLLAGLPRMSTRSRAQPVVAEPADEYDEYDDMYDPMADYTAAQKRRVLALKEVQAKYDEVNKDYHREVAQLQAKYQTRLAPLLDERLAVVSGQKEVGKFDVPDDDTPDGPLKNFWLTALQNHEKVSIYITERDSEVLSYLTDIRSEPLTGEDRGFTLAYHFAENPFFTEKVLTKTYVLQPEDEVVPKEFIGCKISWTDKDKDPTLEPVKKRLKNAKGEGKRGDKAFIVEHVPCDSFFNTFDPPKIPADNTAMSDETLDELQEELTVDFDIGYAIKDTIIPRAVEWYTGEIMPFPEGDEGEDEYYEDEEEEAEALPPPPPKGSKGRR